MTFKFSQLKPYTQWSEEQLGIVIEIARLTDRAELAHKKTVQCVEDVERAAHAQAYQRAQHYSDTYYLDGLVLKKMMLNALKEIARENWPLNMKISPEPWLKAIR